MTDPRFDPRFQRGYTGEDVAPAAPTPAETPHLGREFTVDHGLSSQTWALGETLAGAGDVEDAGEAEPAHRNPWLIVLWVVSIATIVVPTAVFRQALAAQRNVQWSEMGPPPEVIFLQLALQLVPALVLMGGIGVLLAIGIHAWGWSNRHRRATA